MNRPPKPLPSRRRGFALPTALLMVLLITTISFGLILVINTESRVSGTDLDNTRAFYAAEAAMEKMVADVNRLYAENQNPSVSQIEALASSRPSLDGASYSEYQIRVAETAGVPDSEVRLISGGPFEGMIAQIVPMTLTATARGLLSAEVRMSRDIQVAQIPVFQFGIFSEEDLSYFPGPNFDFGGRVHTNGNLFLASSSELVFRSKITAVEGVVRAELSNGLGTIATGRTAPVRIPTAPGGCDNARPACRDLQENEGSRLGGASSPYNPNWENLSTSVYNGFVLTSETGARRLDLPFVSTGALPIEIVRRPPPGEDSGSLVAQSRLYNQAQIRVLLADSPGQLPGGGVRLANVAPYASGEGGGHIFGATGTPFAEGVEAVGRHQVTPPGLARGLSYPLVDGYLLVQASQGGGWIDVTSEWLDLGISRGNPTAILRFQVHESGSDTIPLADLAQPNKYIPINFYDAREGEVRDVSLGYGNTSCAVGGIINAVELDVGNLSSWLAGGLGVSGGGVDYRANNGYLLYFSDRRGMGPLGAGRPDYGFEDVVNPSDPLGLPNGVLDVAEDVNENGVLDTAGALRLGDAFGVANGNPVLRVDCMTLGRKNRVTGPRHALRLVNGGLGLVPTRPDGGGGFTVGSENPVYVLGNYNAATDAFADPHAAAAIIADAVTLLSNSWSDLASFQDATYVGGGSRRTASETSYRVAIAAGKNISWPHPAWSGNEDYGLDGGTHNFLRYLERWGGQTLHYRGSLVSLYFAQQGVGLYKCCSAVYTPPTRDYQFDTDFLRPEKLPPATPRFRDIVNLHFQQIFSPE